MLFVVFLNYFVYILFGKITSIDQLIDISQYECHYMINRFTISRGHFKNETGIISPFLFPQFLCLYMFSVTDIACQKGESFNSGNILDKKNQFKFVLLYIIVLYINYILYENTIIPNVKITSDSFYDYFLIYELNYDYFHNILKTLEGLFRLIIDINFNDEKYSKNKKYVLEIITFIKYVLDLSYQIKINIFLYINHEFFIYFFIYEIRIIINFIKFVKRIYSKYYSIIIYISSLTDFDINLELELLGDINKNMNEEEINSIKKEKIPQCSICLDDMEKGKYLNCGHAFHYVCIKEWFDKCMKCPYCNYPVDLQSNKKTAFLIKKLEIKKDLKISDNIKDKANNDININGQKEKSNDELIQNIELGSKQPNKEKMNYIDCDHSNNNSFSNPEKNTQ